MLQDRSVVEETNELSSGPLVYDLSELLTIGSGKLKYYGIARVVADIGVELFKSNEPVRFVVFSPGHEFFFEVFPRLDPTAYGGVDFGLSKAVPLVRLRSVFHSSNRMWGGVSSLTHRVIRLVNRRLWIKFRLPVTEIDLRGARIISAARPKMMVPMLKMRDQKKLSYHFYPLLHDVIPLHDYDERRSQGFPKNFLGDTAFVMSRSSHLIANSKFTKKDIVLFSSAGMLPKIKGISEVPLAHECREGCEDPAVPILETPFILTVGSQVGRKNLEVVLEALLRLKKNNEPIPHLVLAGARRDHIIKFLAQKKYVSIQDKITYVFDPSQTDLVRLYQTAVALILPSRIEGWGLPAAEALWLGTPVICSDIPVMHEVCGESALYFDPDDPLALAQHIENCLRGERPPPKPRRELRTWQTVARDLLDVICR